MLSYGQIQSPRLCKYYLFMFCYGQLFKLSLLKVLYSVHSLLYRANGLNRGNQPKRNFSSPVSTKLPHLAIFLHDKLSLLIQFMLSILVGLVSPFM